MSRPSKKSTPKSPAPASTEEATSHAPSEGDVLDLFGEVEVESTTASVPVVVELGHAPSAEVQATDADGEGQAPDDEPGATRVGEEPEPVVLDQVPMTPVPAVEVEAEASPTLRAHPAAELFPMLPDDQLAELAKDIRERGLIEPVVLHEGLVLDGRNRLAACLLAGIEPSLIQWDGVGSPTAWVLSRNLRRRHLTPSQRAAVAHEALPLLEAEAKDRQRAAAARTNAGKAGEETLPETVPEAAGVGEARALAAVAAGANPHYVSDLKKVAAVDPALVDEVRKGTVTVPQAKRIAAEPDAEARAAAVAEAKAAKSTRKRPAKAAEAATSGDGEADTILVPIHEAVTALAKLLDGVPKAARPTWWQPLRAALRVVTEG